MRGAFLLLDWGGGWVGRRRGGAIVRAGCRWARCRFGGGGGVWGCGWRWWWGSRLGWGGVSWCGIGGRGGWRGGRGVRGMGWGTYLWKEPVR